MLFLTIKAAPADFRYCPKAGGLFWCVQIPGCSEFGAKAGRKPVLHPSSNKVKTEMSACDAYSRQTPDFVSRRSLLPVRSTFRCLRLATVGWFCWITTSCMRFFHFFPPPHSSCRAYSLCAENTFDSVYHPHGLSEFCCSTAYIVGYVCSTICISDVVAISWSSWDNHIMPVPLMTTREIGHDMHLLLSLLRVVVIVFCDTRKHEKDPTALPLRGLPVMPPLRVYAEPNKLTPQF